MKIATYSQSAKCQFFDGHGVSNMNFVSKYMAVSLSWSAVASLEYTGIFVSVACHCSGPPQGILGQAETKVRERNEDNRFFFRIKYLSLCVVCAGLVMV